MIGLHALLYKVCTGSDCVGFILSPSRVHRAGHNPYEEGTGAGTVGRSSSAWAKGRCWIVTAGWTQRPCCGACIAMEGTAEAGIPCCWAGLLKHALR